jgi:hypothetical protein
LFFALEPLSTTTGVGSWQRRTAGKIKPHRNQAILYFNALAPHQDVALKIRLRAKYLIRATRFSPA